MGSECEDRRMRCFHARTPYNFSLHDDDRRSHKLHVNNIDINLHECGEKWTTIAKIKWKTYITRNTIEFWAVRAGGGHGPVLTYSWPHIMFFFVKGSNGVFRSDLIEWSVLWQYDVIKRHTAIYREHQPCDFLDRRNMELCSGGIFVKG